MTKKLFAVATALLTITGLIVASAWAGPGARSLKVGSDGALRPLSRGDLPFDARQVRAAATERPVRVASVPEISVPSLRVGKLEAGLVARMDDLTLSEDAYDVIVTTSVDPAELAHELDGFSVDHTFRRTLYGFSARLTRVQIEKLQGLPEVESIGANEPVKAFMDQAAQWTGVGKVRDDFSISGDGDGFRDRYSTRDVVIAVVDTGIDAGHKDLKGKVVGWKDLIADKPTPYDDNGHGTHVAGTAAGAGAANRSFAGVAPGAALVGVKVLDGDGSGTFAGVISGIEWVVANKDKLNVKVLNMSLGSSSSSDGNDALSRAVNGAVEAGIVAVVAAGNNGPDNTTVGSPGAASRAITVCAMRDPGESGWSLAPFSSRGPTADGRAKPDICAPGVRITAPKAGTVDRYVSYSGTSMASPFLAGVVALMMEANPYLSPDEAKETLFATAQDWGAPGQDNDYGHGRINAYRAVQRVLNLPGVGPANPIHAVGKGVARDGAEVWYQIEVTDLNRAIAATLVLTDTLTNYYDLDLFLYDSDGNELSAGQEIGRQETINFMPPKAGRYFVKVQAYESGGPYSLDVSWR